MWSCRALNLELGTLRFELCPELMFAVLVTPDKVQSTKHKAQSTIYSRNEFLTAIRSYTKFGITIPKRTMLANCQGNA